MSSQIPQPKNIPFDSLTLSAVTEGLQPYVGSVVQKVEQPLPEEIVLNLRAPGATMRLLISCDARAARVHFTSIRKPNPAKPFAFCMICRKHLEGARLVFADQIRFDRVLVMQFEGPLGAFNLAVELMGKHSNIILVNDTAHVLDSAKHVTAKMTRVREILPGKRYHLPPTQKDREQPKRLTGLQAATLMGNLSDDPDGSSKRLINTFEGFSPFLANEIVMRSQDMGPAGAWDSIFPPLSAGKFKPTLIRDAAGHPIGAYPFPSVQFPADQQHARDNIHTALDHFFGVALPAESLESVRTALQTAVDRSIASRKKAIAELTAALQESTRANRVKQDAELILANLYQIAEDAESVELEDYYSDPVAARTIVLDPILTAQENAERLFKRYRKLRDGAVHQANMLKQTELSLVELVRISTVITEAPDVARLNAIQKDLQTDALLKRSGATGAREKQPPPVYDGKKVRTYTTPEGFDILYGENAEANDYLTGKVASSNDLWLHVRANTSSHVVIRTKNKPLEVPQQVIHRAALIAAKHSKAQHSSLVPVDITLKKYVRRPRGAASGTVTYQNERTVYVNPTEDF
ncbi:MAG: NFACT family protein [Chthonomonadales bacterium]